jgi:hypothetical protein
MNIEKLRLLYFSPTQTTKKVLNAIVLLGFVPLPNLQRTSYAIISTVGLNPTYGIHVDCKMIKKIEFHNYSLVI